MKAGLRSWLGKLAMMTGLMVLGTAASASATILTYQPADADAGDLDHFYAYTWRIDGINISGQNVTGATLTFKKMFNFDDNANELYIHLLDTAKNSGLRSFQDEVTDPSPLVDDFANTRYHSSPSWLVAAGTADTFLTSRSFATAGKATNDSTSGESNAASLQGWTWYQDGTVYYNGAYRSVYTYTYTFDAAEQSALQSYITNGGNIAIGLDPDCHFYNDGITLTINTSTASVPAVPEPGSLGLLATGLLYGFRRVRRSRLDRATSKVTIQED